MLVSKWNRTRPVVWVPSGIDRPASICALRMSHAFTLSAVLTLAFGIGG